MAAKTAIPKAATRAEAIRIWRNADYRWAPQPGGQYWVDICPHWEIFIHGDRGGGKSQILLHKFAKHTGKGYGSAWRGIIFRESYPDLQDLIAKSQEFFAQFYPQAKPNLSEHFWRFPNGEKLMFKYMRNEKDFRHLIGHEYPFIAFDEIVQWPNDKGYRAMMSCSRSSKKGMPRFFISTTNSWGPGRLWLKKRFIDAALPLVSIRQKIRMEDGRVEISSRVHIQVLYKDNKMLQVADPLYRHRTKLACARDKEKEKSWLEDCWDIAVGAYFTDVWDRTTHVIGDFWPPASWRCYRAFDWGSASPFCVQWWTVSNGEEAPDGNIYPRGARIMFHEWYGNDKTADDPNTGLRMTNKAIGDGIREREKMMANQHGIRTRKGPADPMIFKFEGGPTIADQIGKGLFEEADNSRVAGWQKVRSDLIGDEDRGPNLYVMARCRDTIRTIPEMLRDDSNPDDINTKLEDHAADTLRYFVMHDLDRYKASTVRTSELFGY